MSELSQDQWALEPVNIRACGKKSGSSFNEPAGIITKPIAGTALGSLDPQVLQNELPKRSASGSLKNLTNSSPWSQLSVPLTNKLLACALPVALRQRWQWQ